MAVAASLALQLFLHLKGQEMLDYSPSQARLLPWVAWDTCIKKYRESGNLSTIALRTGKLNN